MEYIMFVYGLSIGIGLTFLAYIIALVCVHNIQLHRGKYVPIISEAIFFLGKIDTTQPQWMRTVTCHEFFTKYLSFYETETGHLMPLWQQRFIHHYFKVRKFWLNR